MLTVVTPPPTDPTYCLGHIWNTFAQMHGLRNVNSTETFFKIVKQSLPPRTWEALNVGSSSGIAQVLEALALLKDRRNKDLLIFANAVGHELPPLQHFIARLPPATDLETRAYQAMQIRGVFEHPDNQALFYSRQLGLCYPKLYTLPPEIGTLTDLNVLFLASNQLTALPPEIGNLTSLQSLCLDENRLSDLPPETRNLTALRELFLDSNQLTDLPSEIGDLTALKELDLRNNPLTLVPIEMTLLRASGCSIRF